MNAEYKKILSSFITDGEAVSCSSYGCGHINRTYLVITNRNRKYILQKINHHIFQDVPALMKNIELVTSHLCKKTDKPNSVLTLIPTKSGNLFLTDNQEYWRMYEFVENSLCLQKAEKESDFYESAVAFGTFQQNLSDFSPNQLTEIIPDFHNTPKRIEQLESAIEEDPHNRVAEVRKEIEFALSRKNELSEIHCKLKSGVLPHRVTHNDTKLNNVLLDVKTRKALCVIDLDTVMPGSCLYDYGDSIRFGAATAAEDTQELSQMTLDLNLLQSYTRGYVRSCPDLTKEERDLLALGAKTMTMECGIRFLTDYISGDHYFATQRPKQNLDRCRSQFRLTSEMERNWNAICEIIQNEI